MKSLLISFLLLTSCAWRHGDFPTDMDHTGAKPQVEGDKDLLEKFEVQTVKEATKEAEATETAAQVEAPKKVIPKKQAPKSAPTPAPKSKTLKKPAKPAPAPVVTSVPAIEPEPEPAALPEDYPEGLKLLDDRAAKVWDQYKPNHRSGESFMLDIHYLGMTVGKIQVSNLGIKNVNGKEAWHFHARFKSAPFYSKIYELDDTVDTFVSADEFLGQRYSLIQRESKQNIDDLQLHDRDQHKTFWFYKQVRPGSEVTNKQQEGYIPYHSIDPFSVLFMFQGLPLRNGDVYEIPLVNKTKVLVLRSTVEGRETIETELGHLPAIRIRATTQYSGEHLKSGDLTLWFSDDGQRRLLRARAKIKIGSVTADIVKP